MTFVRVKPTGFVDDNDTITGHSIDTIDLNQSRAVDGLNGGTYNPDAPIIIQGDAGIFYQAVAAASRIRLSSRTVTRQQSLLGICEGDGVWQWILPGVWRNVSGAGSALFLSIDWPNSQFIQEIRFRYRGAPAHANVDVSAGITMPHVELIETDVIGNNVVVASADDTTTDRDLYEDWHDIVLPVNLVLDRAGLRYSVLFRSELGMDYISFAMLCQMKLVMTIDQYIEY